MKQLIFDAGIIINLSLNNLLWILPKLKKQFNGEFIIPNAVEYEIITKPLQIKRFKLEAIQVFNQVQNKTLTISNDKNIKQIYDQIDQLANTSFSCNGQIIKIIHSGEISVIAHAINQNATAAIDERAMRELLENPNGFLKHLKKKLKRNIQMDKEKIKKLKSLTKNIQIIRSSEIVTIAYDLGLFNFYIEKGIEKMLKQPKKQLLDSLLWGTKLRGCSITDKEIEYIEKKEV